VIPVVRNETRTIPKHDQSVQSWLSRHGQLAICVLR
jgi:hypothetical protein